MKPRLGDAAPTARSSRSDSTRRDLASMVGISAARRSRSSASPGAAARISRAPPWGANPGTSWSDVGIFSPNCGPIDGARDAGRNRESGTERAPCGSRRTGEGAAMHSYNTLRIPGRRRNRQRRGYQEKPKVARRGWGVARSSESGGRFREMIPPGGERENAPVEPSSRPKPVYSPTGAKGNLSTFGGRAQGARASFFRAHDASHRGLTARGTTALAGTG